MDSGSQKTRESLFLFTQGPGRRKSEVCEEGVWGRGLRKGTSEQGGTLEHSSLPADILKLLFPKQRQLALLAHEIISGCVTACFIVLVLY